MDASPIAPPKPLNTVKLGDKLEARARRIVSALGYIVVARAKRTPIRREGRVVANNGNIDLAEGAVDFIAIRSGQRTLFVQVTTIKSTSPRRIKLRGIAQFDAVHHDVILMAWDEEGQSFRIFRREDNFLRPESGEAWAITVGATRWPWEGPVEPKQTTLG